MSANAAEGLSGLLQWSDPVIFDRLRDAYAKRLSDIGTVWRLARLHARVWRALISGDMAKFDSLRADLIVELAAFGLDLDCLAEADSQTMTELVEIVVARFRLSPRQSQDYHLALIELAGRLAPRRAA